MLSNFLKELECPVCGDGILEYSLKETHDAYMSTFDLDDIDGVLDGVLNQFLVFKCMNCGVTQRFTFKSLELLVRKNISKKVMTAKAVGEIGIPSPLKIKFYIYCGGCNGFDGNGSCPKAVYDKCDLRKIPNVL